MELGRLYEHYFTKRETTSYIIDNFSFCDKNGEYAYTTLVLCRPFTVYLKECGAFNVSLLIQRYDGMDKPKAFCSLSQLQKKYSEQGFTVEEQDELTKPIFDFLAMNCPTEPVVNYYYRDPIIVKAQGFSNRSERGKIAYYNMVGVRLERLR